MDAYDFQINTLKFRMATSTKYPYLRTTAQYRTEQVDNSRKVGDQSLTGWWTRGQLSFHRGAGLNYYEVLESEAIIDRFDESIRVDVFEPGAVRLHREQEQFSDVGSTSTVYAMAAEYRLNTLWYRTSGSSVRRRTDEQSPTTQAAATGTTLRGNLTTGDRYAYCAYFDSSVSTTTGIQRFDQTGGGVGVKVYELTNPASDPELTNVWHAKGRLWALDAFTGELFILDDSPASLPASTAGTAVCTLPMSDSYIDFPSLTDGGGAVFMSVHSNLIYSFTPGSDGSLATLSAPVVAGVLPANERIKAIRAHMGVLMIVTDKGVRFAQIDGASLTIGPPSADFIDSDCYAIGAQGSKMYATENRGSGVVWLYEFDLIESVNHALVFPYNVVAEKDQENIASIGSGACEHGTGFAWWADAQVSTTHDATDYEANGELTTGLHRFGTLESKNFRTVSVRGEGVGSIAVYQITVNGTSTLLGTLTLSGSSTVGTYDLTVGAAESVALKFVLTKTSSGSTPVLRGYQLKALPVPERQRLLRVPLMIVDKVRRRHGTEAGKRGRAYTDITALETLERETAIVTFTDHRTGETGTAYIDAVEFQDETPSRQGDNGFGGVAYVTLRVLE